MAIVVGWTAGGTGRSVALIDTDAASGVAGSATEPTMVPFAQLGAAIAEREASTPRPRWVWHDTEQWYPELLAAGIRIERCHDLRLCHAILHGSVLAAPATLHQGGVESSTWDATNLPAPNAPPPPPHAAAALFDLDDLAPVAAAVEASGDGIDGSEGRAASGAVGSSQASAQREGDPADAHESFAEWHRQMAASTGVPGADRLKLLLAAESAGALIAAEMRAGGLPWRAEVHEQILSDVLGPRPQPGALPERMERAAALTRAALGEPGLHLDSQPRLLRALHRNGVFVESTNRWLLREHTHPAIEPLLEYKKLSRLLSANGWAWLEEWVHDGRFRPTFVPGGVVTGRWASSGGGALQIPKQLRAAVVADPGWALIIADVAQLEPRVLAAMARDRSMAKAGNGTDLYAGIVASGAVDTREHAKLAVLGAMYGATTGESGRLVPQLRRVFPDAMKLVDDAARAGERGDTVTTWLGRSSPPPSPRWHEAQAAATQPDADTADERRARQAARDRGRFTRNFVVQGTAAEWSLCWMADLRLRLDQLGTVGAASGAPRSGAAFSQRPHLAFFLHDEIIVHTPLERVDAAATAVREAAASAGRLLFGGFPVDFPLELRVGHSSDEL